jgi:hypothetical protein
MNVPANCSAPENFLRSACRNKESENLIKAKDTPGVITFVPAVLGSFPCPFRQNSEWFYLIYFV